MMGLIGQKVGMTRVFDDSKALPVTVLLVKNNRIAQVKTVESDGYNAVQLAFGERSAKHLSSADKGHLATYSAGAARLLREFRGALKPEGKNCGDEIGANLFEVNQKVDVRGITKGKGFAGVIKRHHFSSNRASHGNSRAHRKPGSTGQCQDPGRTFPGKKMPGRLGGKNTTIQNISVIRVDNERGLLLVRGCVPGRPGGYVIICPAIKTKVVSDVNNSK